ncbi:molybdenum cofactor guanylyltransferase [Maricaulis maris]|uniref:molybdenum cofactor guanylyltransferase n=1 Tax=Maricaulis maris TaxID=74318 RepID=UPI0026EF36F7|nr:molybdenum cofactor guanylyltransferase [Maricaulis maris]
MTRKADTFNITGVVLAGGQSRRMGRDKAMIELDGETLLDRGRALLASTGCGSIRVSGRPGVADAIPDSRPGEGPGHAIFDTLEVARESGQDGVLIIPVDMPGLCVETLTPLLQPASARCRAWEDHPLPVFITAQGALPDRTEAASVRRLLAALGTEWLAIGPDRSDHFCNINAPDDLASFRNPV